MSTRISASAKTAKQSSLETASVHKLKPGPAQRATRKKLPANGRLPRDLTGIPVNPQNQGVPSIVRQELRSPGNPLDTATLREMEPHFGKLGHVRVHTGAQSAASAEAIAAAAYTYGNDVVFGGRHCKNTKDWRDLLAHELVHVAQQRSSTLDETRELAHGSHLLEKNARSVLAEGAAIQSAPRAIVQRQSVDEPLPPVSLFPQKQRPSVMSQHLGFHLQPGDRQAIHDFLSVGDLSVGQYLNPMFEGKAATLDQIADRARSLVLPIISREDVKSFVTGEWLMLLTKTTELPPLDPMQFSIPMDAPLAAGEASGPRSTPAILSDWTAAVGGQWTYHLNSKNPASTSMQVQFTHGSGAVQQVFQYQIDTATRAVQYMGGLEFQASKEGKILGIVVQGQAFLQLMAGLTQAAGQASGAITVQIQAGLQATATFGKITVSLQIGPSLTLQDQQKPAWDINVAQQSGGPDKFGPITTPGGGQFAGFTLRF